MTLFSGAMPVANVARSFSRASDTSASSEVRNTRGTVGSSTDIRLIVGRSNDWMMTGVFFSAAGVSMPCFFIDSTKTFAMSIPRAV